MFKIVPKNHGLPAEAWAHGENEEAFLGGINENECARLSGIQVRNEYLKTHWERTPAKPQWVDVTGKVGVSETGATLTCGCWALNTNSNLYRFVKIDAYVKPIGGFVAYGSMRDFMEYLETQRTTLLRVERKAE